MIMITLIVPIYNGEKTLKRCIESILKQTYSNFELILIDDGSTDRSKQICEEYSLNDCRIKVISKKNEGAGIARNLGIEIATGDYIMFPDCDDWIEESMIEDMLTAITKNDFDLAICKSRNCTLKYDKVEAIEKSDIEKTEYMNKEEVRRSYINLLEKNMILGPSDKMYKMQIIKEKNLKFPNIRRSQDIVFNLEYLMECDKVTIINKSLYNYVLGETNGIFKKLPNNYVDIVKRLLNMWLKIKKEWGGEDIKWNRFLGEYVAREIYMIIVMSFNSNEMSHNERKIFIENILMSEEVKKSIVNYKFTGNKNDIVIFLIKKKYINLLIMLTKINVIKNKFKISNN